MNNKITALVRLALVVIGIYGAITGFAFVLSNGKINPIPDLSYANGLSGIVFGTIGIVIAVVEVGQLYYGMGRDSNRKSIRIMA
jgi:hypothetical protein